MLDKKTAIITGASGGIGASLVEAFLKLGYHVVGTSRKASQSLAASPHLVLVDDVSGSRTPLPKLLKPRSGTHRITMRIGCDRLLYPSG